MANTVELVFGADQVRTTSQVISDLQAIAKNIEASGTTKLRFSIDTKGIESAGSAIQKNVKAFSLTNVANESKKAMSAATAEMTRAKIATQNVKTESAKLVGQKQAEIAAHKSNAAAIQEEISKLRLQKAVGSSSSGSVNLNSQAVANVSYSNISNTVSELTSTKQATTELTNSFSKLALAKSAFDNAPTKANLDAYNAQKTTINSLISSINRATASEKQHQQSIHSTESDLLQYKKVLAQVESQYNRYSANIQKSPELDSNYQSVITKLKSGISSGNFDFKDVTDARTQVADLDNTLTETGGKVETFTQKLKNLFGIHLTTALTMVGIHALVQGLNQVYNSVVKLDEAVVNLQVATGYSREQTQALINDYSNYAKELGATTTQVADSANDWLRQGYSIEQANTLIKDSMMLSKLGMIESSESTTDLTAVMKAYGVQISDVSSIVDKFTKIDMEAATSAGDIATAMSYTATSANDAGVSIDKLAGYIASVAETSQAGAENVGTFLKTMFARMSAIKAGDLVDPTTSDDISNVESALSGLGIKLRDSNSEFRNFGDVLDEVAGRWSSFSSVQQAAVASAFSGTRQIDKFRILMSQYSTATKYATDATNSQGSALEKYNNSYLKSVEAAQDRVTASFENFSNTILNSDLVAGTFNTGSGILDFLTKIIDFGDGAIPKLALLVAGIAALTKVQTALNLSYTNSTGRHKMICLVNMPVNDLVATRNELVA